MVALPGVPVKGDFSKEQPIRPIDAGHGRAHGDDLPPQVAEDGSRETFPRQDRLGPDDIDTLFRRKRVIL